MTTRPTGSVSLMFTDIEGSTKLLERLRERYALVLEEHREILRGAFERHGGFEVDTQGDSFFVAFGTPADAIGCALDIQRELSAHSWPGEEPVRVRIGIHTGVPTIAPSGYVGIDVHRGARIGAAAHGGQVLLSEATRVAAETNVPPDVTIERLGVFRFKGLAEPLAVFELRAPGLATDFPQIRTSAPEDEPPADGEPPYKGLLQFEEEDADRFFGRERLVEQLVATVREQPFLAVVGASGSGKSSLIRAGVIPALRRDSRWRTAVMTPTGDPPAALAAALGKDDVPRKPTVLVVDQFEEVFTLCHDAAGRAAFVNRLMGSIGPRLHLLLTLRADFYADVAQFPELRAGIAEHQMYVGPMEPDDLRRAIEQPARLGGWDIAPGLVDLLLRDVGSEPGALPLLSHALLETWRRRRGSRMTLKGYFESGEVRGAIARTADRLYVELDPDDQQTAREILLRLTELGEGTQDTRRRAPLDELVPAGVPADAEGTADVLRRLVDARLITVDEGAAEVAHEALIREWPLLRDWLHEDREGLRTQRQLSEAATEWQSLGRETSLLFRGARLATAREWAEAHPRALNAGEQAFLGASIEAEERDERERAAQQRRDLEAARRIADAERLRAEDQAAANRRLRRRALVLVGAVVVAIGLGGAALLFARQAQDQAGRADEAARIAQARALAAAANEQLRRDPELSLLLATRAVELHAAPDTDRALRVALEKSLTRGRLSGHDGQVRSLTYSRDGDSILTASDDGLLRLWDVVTQTERRAFRPEHGRPFSAAISADGSRVIGGQDDGGLMVWDSATGAVLASLWAHQAQVKEMALSPDGSLLATFGGDGAVRLWDTNAWSLVPFLAQVENIDLRAGAFSSDGKSIVTGDLSGVARLYDVATGREIRSFVGNSDAVQSVAFSPDGSRLLSGGRDSSARVWDVATGAQIALLRGHTGPVLSVGFDPTGRRAITTSTDGTVRLWDSSSGDQLLELAAGTGGIESVAMSPNGKQLATGATNGEVRLWSVRPEEPLLDLVSVGFTLDVAISPDGSKLALGSEDGVVRIYDPTTGALLKSLRGRAPLNVVRVSFDANGSRIVAIIGPAAVIWDAASGAELVELGSADETLGDARFDPAGMRVATASNVGVLKIHEAGTGNELVSIETGHGSSTAVAFSPDGSHVFVGGGDGTISEWDAGTKSQVRSFVGHQTAVQDLKLSYDGTLLASVADDSVRVWDLGTGQAVHVLKADYGFAYRAAFSPDDKRLATGGDDGAAHVWDLGTGELLADIPSDPRAAMSVAYGTDGRILVGNYSSSASLYACELCSSTSEALALAHRRVTRDLTADERITFLHEAPPAIANVTPSPIASLPATPAVTITPPPQPTLAADDICTVPRSCDLVAGDYRPSVFRPQITLHLGLDVLSFGQSPGAIYVNTEDGSQISVLDSQRVFAANGDTAVVLQPASAGLLAYLRTLSWLSVSPDEPLTIGGRPGTRVRVTSDVTESLPTIFTDPYPFLWSPGEHMTVLAVGVEKDRALVIVAEWLGGIPETDFDALVDELAASLEFR